MSVMRLLRSILTAILFLPAMLVLPGGQAATVPPPIQHAKLSAVIQPAISAQAAAAAHAAHVAHLAHLAKTPARATLTAYTESLGNRVLDKAESRTGDWYVYGAAGPGYFDCSGLVYWAAQQIGLSLPRTTYGMLSSWHLYPIPLSSAQRGDLMFYGSGHVEINTMWYHATFGAQNTGTRVGYHTWNGYWQPTMAFRLR